MGSLLALIGLAQAQPAPSYRESAQRTSRDLRSGAIDLEQARAELDRLAATTHDIALGIHSLSAALSQQIAVTPALGPKTLIPVLDLPRRAARLIDEVPRAAYWTVLLIPHLVARGERERVRRIVSDVLAELPLEDSRRSRLHAWLAQIETYRQDWDAALDQLDRAERALVHDPQRVAFGPQILGIRGDVYLQMGLDDLAREAILTARDAIEALGPDHPHYSPLRAGLDVHLANLRLATEDWETLIREVDSSLRQHDGHRARPATRAILLVRRGIAELSLEVRDPKRARTAAGTFREVLAMKEAAPQHERMSARIRLVECELFDVPFPGALEAAGEQLELVASELEAEGSEPIAPLDDAFLAALRHRWSRLSEAEPPLIGAARRALAASADRMHRHWIETRLRPGGVGYLERTRVRTVLAELIEAKLGGSPPVSARSEALAVLLEAQEVSTLTRELHGPRPTLERIRRELLGPEDGLLLYLPARIESHVFAVDRAEILHARLGPDHRLDALRVRYLERLLRSPASRSSEQRAQRDRDWRAASRQLADALLPDRIRQRVGQWRSVTIVSPDLLGYLPFEALLLDGGRYLGLEKAVTYLPTCATGLALSRRAGLPRREDGRHTWILAAPESPALAAEGLSALPFASEDRRRLLAAIGTEAGEIRLGEQASFEALEAGLPGRAVLQLLVHGYRDPGEERSAGVLLAPSEDGTGGGRVGIERFESLEDLPELVVMTACGSGRGPDRVGDPGAADFTGALLRRGARAVVLPRTALAYSPTVSMSEIFHRRLRTGDSVGESLRHARRALAESAETRDPYYWALLHVRGLGGLVVFPPETESSPIDRAPSVELTGMALSLLAGLSAGWLLTRRRSRPRPAVHG